MTFKCWHLSGFGICFVSLRKSFEFLFVIFAAAEKFGELS